MHGGVETLHSLSLIIVLGSYSGGRSEAQGICYTYGSANAIFGATESRRAKYLWVL